MIASFSDPQLWVSLLTLTAMEVVLGIDNLVLLAVLADRLPQHRRVAARRLGLLMALGTRLLLLFSITWIMRLTAPVLDLPWHSFSWRDIILVLGGLFLVYKATREIHHRIEGADDDGQASGRVAGFAATVVQIALLDIVFSLDSVITAVGMASDLTVMVTAVVIAMAVMMAGANTVASFIGRHPTVKMLALGFLLLIGATLMAEGFGAHLPKGYIYAAMGFSALLEVFNQLATRRRRQRSAEAPGHAG